MNVRVRMRLGRRECSLLYSAIASGVVSDGETLAVFTTNPFDEFAFPIFFHLADVALLELDEEGGAL